jgi:hypothetical protein
VSKRAFAQLNSVSYCRVIFSLTFLPTSLSINPTPTHFHSPRTAILLVSDHGAYAPTAATFKSPQLDFLLDHHQPLGCKCMCVCVCVCV